MAGDVSRDVAQWRVSARRVRVIAADTQGAAASMGDGANGEARFYGG